MALSKSDINKKEIIITSTITVDAESIRELEQELYNNGIFSHYAEQLIKNATVEYDDYPG